jgi:tyrosine-specific transport protein
VYLLWEVIVLGVVPVDTEQGLVAMMHAEHTVGKQAVTELPQLLSDILHNAKVTMVAQLFALCAILTSFIGVALGLFDFFADGFHIPKNHVGKVKLAFLTFLPPILMVLYYPSFLTALHYAGFFAAILLVIFPALMVWWGRYVLKTAAGYQVAGGRWVVILTLVFGFAVIALEILNRINILPSPLHEVHLFF